MKQKNELPLPLGKVKKTVTKWLSLEDDTVVDVMLATVVANMLDTDPNWCLIVGPPSSAKTEILRSLTGHPRAHFLSNLTPTTLVSGMKPKGKLPEPSLLPKLDGKTLVLKDFTTVLSMRNDAQAEILAQLREVYDGSYSKAFGNGKVVDWEGHVGLLGAVTPVYDRHYSVIGTLGDRFLLYRTPDSNGRVIGLQAQKMVGQEETMRNEIREVVHRFIDQFNDLGPVKFETNKEVNKMIVELACFVAYGRCPVDRDPYSRTVNYMPQPEGTPRLVKQLMQIGTGLTLIHEKPGFDLAIYEILKKIGRDLLPAARLKILRYLWDEKVLEYLKERRKTKDIADAVNMPVRTAKLILEDMMLVKLLNRDVDGDQDKSPYTWQITDYAGDFIQNSEVFEVSQTVPF
ncbi:MAG: hypothetical protein ABIE47_13170 [Pseudomonadota bacterium]